MMPLASILLALIPTIWVVDATNGPGTNFTDLPAAVAVATSGDTILVRSGTYTPFNVSGKSLTIRGAGAATTLVALPAPVGAVETTIDNVPVGATFYVSGLNFSPPDPYLTQPPLYALRINGATSQVVVSDSVIHGAIVQVPVGSSPYGTPALIVDGGAEVHLARCTITGGVGFTVGGHGVQMNGGSKLAADASTVTGGNVLLFNGGIGGSGLVVFGGIATVSRCSFTGGSFSGGAVGQGGDAVAVNASGMARIAGRATDVLQGGLGSFAYAYAIRTDGTSLAVVHGPVSFGFGSSPTFGNVTSGPPLPYVSITGTATPSGELVATQQVTVTIAGLVFGAPLAFGVDLRPAFASVAALGVGELLVPYPPAVLVQGNFGASAGVQITVTPAAYAPWLVGFPIYVQCATYDAVTGQYLLSNEHVRTFL